MKSHYLLSFLLLFLNTAIAQNAEPQISFAMESQPHEYYVEQAKLWWQKVEDDKQSEDNWYNYFRACRNALGSADWQTDIIDKHSYLRHGQDIVDSIQQYLPESFTYFYLSYMTNGIGVANSDNLLKAYELNPDFPGIHSSMISYAVSSWNTKLRERINKQWYQTNYLSPQLLAYGYNVLMSLDTNAILLTQNDNDTYPLWMLQDALNIRKDVYIINIDFMLMSDYRTKLFEQLGIDKEIQLRNVDIKEYRENWAKAVDHVLTYYSGKKPLYIGMTLFNTFYKKFEDDLYVSGLALRHSKQKLDLLSFNKHIYENKYLLDYLYHHFYIDRNQMNVNYQNINYINIFKILYDDYKLHNMKSEADKIKHLAFTVVNAINNPNWQKFAQKEFN